MNAIHLTDKEDGVLLTASLAGSTVSIGPERLAQARETAIYIVWGKEAIGGTVIVETAHHVGYIGQWQALGEIAWSASDAVQMRQFPGAHLALRLRLIDDVVGGSITIYGIAN